MTPPTFDAQLVLNDFDTGKRSLFFLIGLQHDRDPPLLEQFARQKTESGLALAAWSSKLAASAYLQRMGLVEQMRVRQFIWSDLKQLFIDQGLTQIEIAVLE